MRPTRLPVVWASEGPANPTSRTKRSSERRLVNMRPPSEGREHPVQLFIHIPPQLGLVGIQLQRAAEILHRSLTIPQTKPRHPCGRIGEGMGRGEPLRLLGVYQGAPAVTPFGAIAPAEKPQLGLVRKKRDGLLQKSEASLCPAGVLVGHRPARYVLDPLGISARSRPKQQLVRPFDVALLPEQEIAEVPEGRCEVGVQSDGLLESLLRLTQPALLLEDQPRVVVRAWRPRRMGGAGLRRSLRRLGPADVAQSLELLQLIRLRMFALHRAGRGGFLIRLRGSHFDRTRWNRGAVVDRPQLGGLDAGQRRLRHPLSRWPPQKRQQRP